VKSEAAAGSAGESGFGCARGIWYDCADYTCRFVNVIVAYHVDVFGIWVSFNVGRTGRVCVECCCGEIFGHHEGE
jgi:hypothetical protein